MFSFQIYADLKMSARAYTTHPNPKIAPDVMIEFESVLDRRHSGSLSLTPDQADALVDQLRLAAEAARAEIARRAEAAA